MDDLTEKQKDILEKITKLTNEQQCYPTIGEIKRRYNFKSYNTIYQYISVLKKKNYISYDNNNKRILVNNNSCLDNNFLIIPYLNNNNYLKVSKTNLDSKKTYVSIIVKNSNLKSNGIYLKDTLIIEKGLKNIKNKLVLLKVNDEYKVYKYTKKDGFHHLYNDKEDIILDNINLIIGKVVLLIRKNFN